MNFLVWEESAFSGHPILHLHLKQNFIFQKITKFSKNMHGTELFFLQNEEGEQSLHNVQPPEAK